MDNECTSRVCAGSREVGRQHYIVLFGRALYSLIVYLFNVNSDVMKMSAMSVLWGATVLWDGEGMRGSS